MGGPNMGWILIIFFLTFSKDVTLWRAGREVRPASAHPPCHERDKSFLQSWDPACSELVLMPWGKPWLCWEQGDAAGPGAGIKEKFVPLCGCCGRVRQKSQGRNRQMMWAWLIAAVIQRNGLRAPLQVLLKFGWQSGHLQSVEGDDSVCSLKTYQVECLQWNMEVWFLPALCCLSRWWGNIASFHTPHSCVRQSIMCKLLSWEVP